MREDAFFLVLLENAHVFRKQKLIPDIYTKLRDRQGF